MTKKPVLMFCSYDFRYQMWELSLNDRKDAGFLKDLEAEGVLVSKFTIIFCLGNF